MMSIITELFQAVGGLNLILVLFVFGIGIVNGTSTFGVGSSSSKVETIRSGFLTSSRIDDLKQSETTAEIEKFNSIFDTLVKDLNIKEYNYSSLIAGLVKILEGHSIRSISGIEKPIKEKAFVNRSFRYWSAKVGAERLVNDAKRLWNMDKALMVFVAKRFRPLDFEGKTLSDSEKLRIRDNQLKKSNSLIEIVHLVNGKILKFFEYETVFDKDYGYIDVAFHKDQIMNTISEYARIDSLKANPIGGWIPKTNMQIALEFAEMRRNARVQSPPTKGGTLANDDEASSSLLTFFGWLLHKKDIINKGNFDDEIEEWENYILCTVKDELSEVIDTMEDTDGEETHHFSDWESEVYQKVLDLYDLFKSSLD